MSPILAAISAGRPGPGPLSHVRMEMVEVVAAADIHLRELRHQLRVGLEVDAPAEAEVNMLRPLAFPEEVLQRKFV